MNKQVLGIIGLGAIGYLAYKYIIQPQQGDTSFNPYSYPNDAYNNAALGGQPQEQYPLRAIVPPRVDNSSQPWYGGDRGFNLNTPDNSIKGLNLDFQQTVQYVQGAADISDSLQSLWGDLSGWFSDDGDTGEYYDADLDSFDWNSLTGDEIYA